jgi:hypothetical protein
VILSALHDGEARRELARLGSPETPLPADWPEGADSRLLRERARRASEALDPRPLMGAENLPQALEAAAALFDAHLYFEVHELLEEHWRPAAGPEREALQGLIQVAVGLQHLANGNLAGARALLEEGAGRLRRGGLAGLALEPFARAVAGIPPGGTTEMDWTTVPRFPRRHL